MTASKVRMRRFMRQVLCTEDRTDYSGYGLARPFKIPSSILRCPAIKKRRNHILLLPAEILETILLALDASCDRIIFALTCKIFASIYKNAKLSEESRLWVVPIRMPVNQIRLEANALVCRLSAIWSFDLRFCPRCLRYRSCERAFWNQMREYIKSVLQENRAAALGPKEKRIDLKPPPAHASWNAIPTRIRDDININLRVSSLNRKISEWCGLGRFADPPDVETVSIDPHAQYWMNCPAHVLDDFEELRPKPNQNDM